MLPIKFRFDYCKNSVRKSFNTTLDQDLIEQLKYIKKNTGIPISKLIEVAMQPHLQSQETFDNFMEMVRKY
ncbi:MULTISPECIES: ribbon-helix-helix domain-containing protein [unclassified Clostridium]|uniref:ribbon-helix-helix domain-containing protein n=1 Tax=unclassified Clostridium TaxID=2614128 RepID=UPI002079AA2A|nr:MULTISPECIES: ribbon-helix-helix domain-containing protein [unclassified Clostridium]